MTKRTPQTSRRVNANSVHNTRKRILEKETGKLVWDKRKWTNEQKNMLMICWLKDMKYLSEAVSLKDLFGKTNKAIERMAWGIATGYCNPKTHESHPGNIYRSDMRLYREGKPYNQRELRLIRQCLGARNKYGTFRLSYLAEVMARVEGSIYDMLFTRAVAQRGMNKTPLPGWEVPQHHFTDEEVLELAYQSLKNI